MYQIAICDDSSIDREILQKKIYKTEKYVGLFRIYEYASGTDLLKAMESINFSLVFLDIQMNGMDGEETAVKIREINNRVVLVFITGYAEPTPRTFHVQAYRYIKKNMLESQVCKEIEDSLDKMAQTTQMPVVWGKINEKKMCIQIDDIVWIEKIRNGVLIHLNQGVKQKYKVYDALGKECPVRGNYHLKELYETLKYYGYGNPHDSYIINFMYLDSDTKKEITVRGYDEVFSVARSKAVEFYSMKKQYFTGKYGRRS